MSAIALLGQQTAAVDKTEVDDDVSFFASTVFCVLLFSTVSLCYVAFVFTLVSYLFSPLCVVFVLICLCRWQDRAAALRRSRARAAAQRREARRWPPKPAGICRLKTATNW